MEASSLARIEFRQPLGTFTAQELTELTEQLERVVRRIHARQWDAVTLAVLSASTQIDGDP